MEAVVVSAADVRRRRRARAVAAAGLVTAIVLPIALWYRVVALVAEDFRIDVEYLLTGWTPWMFMAGGIAFMVPVVLSVGRDPESRLFPRARNAYAGWGISLYLLGFLLAFQVAQIMSVLHP